MDLIKRRIAFLYRCILFLVCFWCLYLNSGLAQGEFQPTMFIFFTIISNLACFLFVLLLIINSATTLTKQSNIVLADNERNIDRGTGFSRFLSRIRGAVTMMITVTFLIYHFLLVPQLAVVSGDFNPFGLQNVLAHYVVPAMIILDWLIFSNKNAFRRFDPLLWLLIPLAYFAFTIIRAQIGGPISLNGSQYPYFFIDVDALGIAQVSINAVLVLLFFALIAYLIYFIDKFHLQDDCIYFGQRKLFGKKEKG